MENKFPGKDISEEDHKSKFPLSSIKNEKKVIKISKDISFGSSLVPVIAGPNTLEDRDMIFKCCEMLEKKNIKMLRGGIYKPLTFPYRSKKYFELGDKGIKILEEIKKNFDLIIVSEIMESEKIPLISNYVDVFQIGARNMQNFPLITNVAKTMKPILLKRHFLINNRNFAVFFFSSILICIPLAFYYQNANPFLTEIGVANATGKMTLGQISEVVFMLLLPVFLTRYGIKKTLLFGMLAWALRYVLFAYGNADSGVWMLLLGIALHGICYDFFFVSGQIYTDSKAGDKYKSSAQGLITLATYGVGMLIGFWAAGQISEYYTTATGDHTWESIWILPAAFSALVFILFALVFKNETIEYKKA